MFGGEFRFGTDHPVYLRHALMVMRRHTAEFEWLTEGPQSWQNRPLSSRPSGGSSGSRTS